MKRYFIKNAVLGILLIAGMLSGCSHDTSSKESLYSKLSRSLPSANSADEPVVYFSDLSDGPRTGWEGSATKGAAVSIWGRNFGTSRGSNYVTVGGVNLTSAADYAEWGATTNPTTASGQQRITFWLKNTIPTGAIQIRVRVNNKTSNPIDFYCRDLGTNKIYFMHPNGNNSNDGLMASSSRAWKSLYKIKNSMVAGDILYVMGGVYKEVDPINTSIKMLVYFSNQSFTGQLNKSIVLASYPGQLAQLGDGSNDVLTIFGIADYARSSFHDWTISKFKMLGFNNSFSYDTSSKLVSDRMRIIGNDLQAVYAMTINTSTGYRTTDLRIYGNYFHHVGKHPAPQNPATVATGSLTGLTGAYKVRYSYFTSWNGSTTTHRENKGTREGLLSQASPEIQLNNSSIRVTINAWLAGTTHIKLYRTKANGSTYYFDQVVAVPASGSLVIDTNTPDASLGAAIIHNDYAAHGYKVGALYPGGFGIRENNVTVGYMDNIHLGWNEMAHCNGNGGQFYGHFTDDDLRKLYVHDNYIHHAGTMPLIIGGGDSVPLVTPYCYVKQAWVYNNIFYNNGESLRISDGNNGSHGGRYYVYNNIFYSNVGQSYIIQTVFPELLIFKNNIAYMPNGIGDYFSYSDGSSNGYNPTRYLGSNNLYFGPVNKPAWDTSTLNRIDPKFISANPATFLDFRLQSTSPAINAGTSTVSSVVNYDFLGIGRPKGSAYDIGAFEYISQSQNQSPVVSITSPQNGAQFNAGNSISITANASDSDGSITRVEFFQGSTKLGEDTTAPYAYTWSNVPAGSYALTAVAYDDDGAHTTSTPVGISVNQSGGAITVTESSHDGSDIAQNTLDNNLGTKWSALGIGQWVQYDLQSVKLIDSVEIAFYRGAEIVYYFDIEVSNNGTTWTKVYTGQNSKQTLNLELFAFVMTSARYVKIVGKGNWWHAWNRYTEVKVNSIITSASSYDGTHVPAHTLDGDLNSYWSAWGIGEWIQYDLGRARIIDSVDMAFERGNIIKYYFDIEVSLNGVTWTKVYIGQNSGTTAGLELYDFAEVKARYVKIIGKGNMWHEWNRPTEVKINSIITSASSYDGTYVPENTLDGNLNSYWSAWRIGEWIQYDLQRTRTIKSVELAFERGNVLVYSFDIEVSMDGANWTKVYTGQNSGATLGLELFNFTDVSARYVKLVGKGNIWHEWNRLTEIKINKE